jgi:PTEN phosphatase family protein
MWSATGIGASPFRTSTRSEPPVASPIYAVHTPMAKSSVATVEHDRSMGMGNSAGLQKLGQVWALIEKDLERFVLVLLEKLFTLEPAAAMVLRSVEEQDAVHSGCNGRTLSTHIKVVAAHFGRAVRAAVQESAALVEIGPMARPWRSLALGFRSLAHSLVARGFGQDFLVSMGAAVAVALATICGDDWSSLAETWWPKMWTLIEKEMQRVMIGQAQNEDGRGLDEKSMFACTCEVQKLEDGSHETPLLQCRQVLLSLVRTNMPSYASQLVIEEVGSNGSSDERYPVGSVLPEKRQIDSQTAELKWTDHENDSLPAHASELVLRFSNPSTCFKFINALELLQDMANAHAGISDDTGHHAATNPKPNNNRGSVDFWEDALCELCAGAQKRKIHPPVHLTAMKPSDFTQGSTPTHSIDEQSALEIHGQPNTPLKSGENNAGSKIAPDLMNLPATNQNFTFALPTISLPNAHPKFSRSKENGTKKVASGDVPDALNRAKRQDAASGVRQVNSRQLFQGSLFGDPGTCKDSQLTGDGERDSNEAKERPVKTKEDEKKPPVALAQLEDELDENAECQIEETIEEDGGTSNDYERTQDVSEEGELWKSYNRLVSSMSLENICHMTSIEEILAQLAHIEALESQLSVPPSEISKKLRESRSRISSTKSRDQPSENDEIEDLGAKLQLIESLQKKLSENSSPSSSVISKCRDTIHQIETLIETGDDYITPVQVSETDLARDVTEQQISSHLGGGSAEIQLEQEGLSPAKSLTVCSHAENAAVRSSTVQCNSSGDSAANPNGNHDLNSREADDVTLRVSIDTETCVHAKGSYGQACIGSEKELASRLCVEKRDGSMDVATQHSSEIPSTTEREAFKPEVANVHIPLSLDRPYPYTTAEYIPQQDIIEDGLPPLPRSVAAQRHLEVMITVKDVQHLPVDPVTHSLDSSSFFCVSLRINGQTFQTDARRGSVATGCKWFERFQVHLPDLVLRECRQAVSKGERGPTISISLFDSGKYSAKSALGQAEMPVSRILDLNEDGLCVSLRLQKKIEEGAAQEEYVVGQDGEVTCLDLMFHTPLAGSQEEWVPPSIEQTLASCDSGRIVLNPPRKRFTGRVLDKNTFSPGSKKNVAHEHDSGHFFSSPHNSSAANVFQMVPHSDSADESRSEVEHFQISAANVSDWALQTSDDEEDPDEQIKDIDYYWRERLEHTLDSLSVNILVILLVLIDLSNIIVFVIIFPTPDDEQEPLPAVVLSVFVIGMLFIELTLRQTAQGRRFWRSWGNIFDTFVVYLSLVILSVRLLMPGMSVKELQGLVALRVLRSVGVALRVIRVLVNLRRARKLSGHVARKLRSTVSQNKRRYKKHGFDLDLTYITNRVIAMGTPAFGKHSSYRNDIHVVSRFMAFRHYGSFFIFNFCDTYTSSDGMTGNYHPGMLFNQVQRIPFEDHGPPLMSEMLQFLEEAQLWLLKDTKNVIAVHCKGGKGRTGVMISALMLWSGHRKSALDALELFTFRRTVNYNAELGLDGNYQQNAFSVASREANQTVEGPSQIRYVHYLEAVLYNGVDVLALNKIFFSRIALPVDEIQERIPFYLSVMVTCMRYPVFDSCNTEEDTVKAMTGHPGDIISIPINTVVWGDVRVELFKHKTHSKDSPKKLFAFCVFNTAFYKDKTHITWEKAKIDVINKDKAHVRVGKDFSITLHLEPNCQHSVLQFESKTRQIFYKYGQRRTLEPGDCLVRGTEFLEDKIFLISSGSVEGLVQNFSDADGGVHHPLGRSVAEACLLGKGDASSCSRVPNVCILGAGMLVGASQFLSHQGLMLYRARTKCEVYELSRSHSVSPTRAKHSSVELDVDGVPMEELNDYYHGMSIMLGTTLSRVRMEAIRLGSLKAWNDRQTVLAHSDEPEKVRSSCISMFGLPMNEQLIGRAKCTCVFPDSRKPVRVRLLLMVNYIILDPAFFGPEIAGCLALQTVLIFISTLVFLQTT